MPVDSKTVRLMSYDGPSTECRVNVRSYDKGEALIKAAPWGAATLAVGLAMVPIPLIHFLSIPLILVGVPFITTLIFRFYKHAAIVTGTGSCPACRGEIPIRVSDSHWPQHRICGACNGSIEIEMVP